MSTEALDRIIKEVKALTPDERRQLINRLTDKEQQFVDQDQHLSLASHAALTDQ